MSFSLTQTYFQLAQILEVRLPHIDPTVYVYRFAKHLHFSCEQTKVSNDALLIIQPLSHDWMVQGSQPLSICGTALILAARMNDFCRSVREVVYIIKVADLTILKRLDEFKDTKSRDLIIEEFRKIWLEQAHDPPSHGLKASKWRKRVRDFNDDGEVIEDPQDITIVAAHVDLSAAPGAPTLLTSSAPATGRRRLRNPRTPPLCHSRSPHSPEH